MRRLLLLLLPIALLCSSCLPKDGPLSWPQIVQCGPTVDDLLPTVSRLLMDGGSDLDPEKLTGQAATELEKLAVQHGADVVACLVDALVQDWFGAANKRMAAGYPPDPLRVAGAKRGARFLSERHVEQVQQPEP